MGWLNFCFNRNLFLVFLNLIFLPMLTASAESTIFVLPVQGELPFLSQIPGTNVFVGPGASSIFKGKVTINGKEYNKIPEPPLTPPEWANGLKERLEAALRLRRELKIVSKQSEAKFIVRTILTRFGEQEGKENIGVVFEGTLLEGKTGEPIAPFTAEGSVLKPDREPEDLSWREFLDSEPESGVSKALIKAANQLAEQVAVKIR